MDNVAFIKETLKNNDLFHALALIDRKVRFEDVHNNMEVRDLLLKKQIEEDRKSVV